MFSELVDTVVQRSARVDRRADVISWANLTIQEMVGKHYFYRNFVEDTVLSLGADPFIMPRPLRLQRFRTARYDGITERYAKFVSPGRAMADEVYFYYANALSYIFKGVIGYVDIAYYQYPQKFNYYETGARPAVWNTLTETWSYLAAYDIDDDTRELARTLVQNWILQDYNELVAEGVLAKVFKAVNDETRAATHFSFFERTYSSLFLGNEQYESLDK